MFASSNQKSNLAAHVRRWGRWVLEKTRAELTPYYPTVNGWPIVAYLWARTVPCPNSSISIRLWLLNRRNQAEV